MVNRSFPHLDWTTGSLPVGVDAHTVDGLISRLVHRPDNEGRTHGLVVISMGHIVREWYGEGLTHESTHISWSMAKSIVHALVGIAVKDGLLSLEQTHLLPQWDNDERAHISVHDLLTMRSGLSWVEDYVDDSISDVIEMLFGDSEHTGDHAAYAAAKSLKYSPGTHWEYSSGTTNILARILANALGEESGAHVVMEKFMTTRLCDVIGMSITPKFDAAGTFVGSSFAYATARDFAKFGYLYLNDGVWNGDRILPAGWVRDAATAVTIDQETQMGYGTHWWTWPDDDGSMIAHGYEGQITWVSPDRDLVVVHVGKTPAESADRLRRGLAQIVAEFPA